MAAKYRKGPKDVRYAGFDEAEPGYTSSVRYVPCGVPSVRHSSEPAGATRQPEPADVAAAQLDGMAPALTESTYDAPATHTMPAKAAVVRPPPA